jgi:hypothetical protein
MSFYSEADVASTEVFFHFTLIIAICSERRHPYGGHAFDLHPTIESSHNSHTETIESLATDASVTDSTLRTVDLHTTFSLIGTTNLDVTLKDLHLHKYASDGVLTLYAVIRKIEETSHTSQRVGKEAIFSFSKCWVRCQSI